MYLQELYRISTMLI